MKMRLKFPASSLAKASSIKELITEQGDVPYGEAEYSFAESGRSPALAEQSEDFKRILHTMIRETYLKPYAIQEDNEK